MYAKAAFGKSYQAEIICKLSLQKCDNLRYISVNAITPMVLYYVFFQNNHPFKSGYFHYHRLLFRNFNFGRTFWMIEWFYLILRYGFPKILTFESANMHFEIGSESEIIDIYLFKKEISNHFDPNLMTQCLNSRAIVQQSLLRTRTWYFLLKLIFYSFLHDTLVKTVDKIINCQ